MEHHVQANPLPPVVILGANGFIGSLLVDELVARKRHVVAVDRFRSGVNRFESTPKMLIRADAESEEKLEKIFTPGCDVVDATGSNSPWLSANYDQQPGMSTLPRSSESALRAAESVGVGRYFYCSSAGAIYGNRVSGSSTEEDEPNPESLYGQEKLAFEEELRSVSSRTTVQGFSWRFSNVYGPRQSFSRGQGLIARAIAAIQADTELPLFGGGTMERDYIFSDDAVSLAADLMEIHPRDHTYNISSGKGITVLDVVRAVEQRFKKAIKLTSVKNVEGFPQRSVVSPGRILRELGERKFWSIETALETYPELTK